MKSIRLIIVLLAVVVFQKNTYAQYDAMANFSLFNEYHKNKDYKTAFDYGWKVINDDPKNFLRFKLFSKMEETLWHLHDSIAVTNDEKKVLADTTLFFYDKAMEYEKDLVGYYSARKAFIMEQWMESNPVDIITLYENAVKNEPNLSSFYVDRLGLVYVTNATDDNDYKMQALELYSKLAEQEPDNPLWNQRMEGIAENVEELVEITKKAWDFDKENLEKAWKYAAMCLRAQDYDKALEPLEFLVSKSPEVVNYWRQLASVYDRLDKTDDAIKAYRKLIDLQPDGRDNYVNLALIYKKLDQLSVARTYLQRATRTDPNWDYPVFIEAQLYEQAARSCDFDFMAKSVYLLAVNTYRKAASIGGQYSNSASDRVRALANSIPTKEDYFFRKLKSGDTVKIEGPCYAWIGASVQVP